MSQLRSVNSKSTKCSTRYGDINWTFVPNPIIRKTRPALGGDYDDALDMLDFEKRFQENMDKNIENYFNTQDVEESNRKLEYFMNQDADHGNTQQALIASQPHIQYSNINRSSIAVSDIPLDALYNDPIDQIKKFELRDGRDVAPI